MNHQLQAWDALILPVAAGQHRRFIGLWERCPQRDLATDQALRGETIAPSKRLTDAQRLRITSPSGTAWQVRHSESYCGLASPR